MKTRLTTDKAAFYFVILAMSYLITGIVFGVLGSFQYVLPSFLKDQLTFEKLRPLHVYLVIAWIFTGAQGLIYYAIPRVANRPLWSPRLQWLHFIMQLGVSVSVVVAFLLGYFGGREYLEFPPLFGLLIIVSWIPFAINFFATLKPNYSKAPVYIWSWSAGILFFFLTMAESYLWLADYFTGNIVRDITVQWKALGSMVGSWNMMVYGSGFYIMERLTKDEKITRGPEVFFFFFLGLTNLMFNWGHHTYIVPAAPWVKTVAYVISMTELLILGHIIYRWRKTVTQAQQNYHRLPFRAMSFADAWIFLNLALAIAISIPEINYYTHGTHITVAHAMGATIGINTMILFAGIFFIIKRSSPQAFVARKKAAGIGLSITNIALIFFWVSLLGSGMIKIASNLRNEPFYKMMKASEPMFKLFAASGVVILIGILVVVIAAIRSISLKRQSEEVHAVMAHAEEV